jgi:fructoselysine-6-P-deglycase FrlB-like protein
MKHGPNALIDERLPVVVVNPREAGNKASELRYEKTHSNIVEVKAREGVVLSILTEGDQMSSKESNHVIEIPHARTALAHPRRHPAATPRLSHRRPARLRRRSAAQPRQVRHGGVAVRGPHARSHRRP